MATERRPKGEGTIYEDMPNHFRGIIDLGYKEGKKVRKSVSGKSRAEVVRKLKLLKGSIERGEVVASDSSTLDTYFDRWLTNRKPHLKDTTYQGYKGIYDTRLKDALGGLKIQKVTTSILNDYLTSQLNDGLTGCTVSKHRALLHNVLNEAVAEGVIPSNPVERVRKIKSVKPDTKSLTKDEAKELLRMAKEYSQLNTMWRTNWMIYYIVYVALNTGLRRGEILGLRWKNLSDNKLTVSDTIIELKTGAKCIPTPKNEESRRTIAVTDELVKVLEDLKDNHSKPNDFIFHTKDGNFIAPTNINRAWGKLKPPCRFHDLRHTHATLLIEAGVNIKAVSQRLGHSDIQTTLNKYAHVLKGTDEAAAETFTGLLS